jgi:hypothetical protein
VGKHCSFKDSFWKLCTARDSLSLRAVEWTFQQSTERQFQGSGKSQMTNFRNFAMTGD